jgi:hypothetical protein
MAINRSKPKPASSDQAVQDFVSKAPDAVPSGPKGVRKGHKLQITHTISPELLQRVDVAAAKTGQSRAAYINLAIYQALPSGIAFDRVPRAE